MINILQCIVIGIVTGAVGAVSVPLSGFIDEIEDGCKCKQCGKRNNCFARKSIKFRKSDYVSEFMLLSYYKVRKCCEYIGSISKKERIVYILLNVLLMIVLFWSKGWSLTSILFSIAIAMLLSLSVVDWNTQYIPLEMSGVILICGFIQLFADFSNWLEYLIGLIAVSGFLFLVDKLATPILRKKYGAEQEIDRVIGDGDIKLMAATGLLLGWKLNFLALGIGCIAGSVIHLALMKIKGSGRQFALGPYLSLGIYITMICGEQLVSWYLNMLGVKPL